MADSESGIVDTPLPRTPIPETEVSPIEIPQHLREPISPSDSSTSRRKKRKTTLPELNTVSDPAHDLLGITPDQRSAAAGQFQHATEIVRTNGDPSYALDLLLSCCKLDPANILYRKILREVSKEVGGSKRGGWFGSLTNLPARGKVRSARNAGDHRKVLVLGEEFLARVPGDVHIQLDMAGSAEELGLADLAVWLLEEARRQANSDLSIVRALAHLYEREKRFPKAISLWEQVHQAEPTDIEASAKIRELSVNDTLARGKYRN